jgi:hypothetical protein
LMKRCHEDLTRRVRGESATNAERLACQLPAFLPLPPLPLDASRVVVTQANSLALVRFDTNNYSVPDRYAHQRVTLRAGIDTIRIECDGQMIAEHGRDWGRHQTVFNWVHYLGVLERKPGALDFARPLKGVSLPAGFQVLRSRLEEADPQKGTVEFIRVLRLHEEFGPEELVAAVQAALRLPRIKASDVRVLLERGREDPTIPLNLESRPQLKAIEVRRPDLKGYSELRGERGAQP